MFTRASNYRRIERRFNGRPSKWDNFCSFLAKLFVSKDPAVTRLKAQQEEFRNTREQLALRRRGEIKR